MDEILLLNKYYSDFRNSAVLCFSETWLNESIENSSLNIPGFQIERSDRIPETSGKKKGGGLCLYINSSWCQDFNIIYKFCDNNLETLIINCKPYYSPREFSSFLLIAVYVPPQACVNEALRTLADQIMEAEAKHPDSLAIVLGDLNKANLRKELPKYFQHVNCPTRGKNTLDHCYTTLKDAYRSLPRAAVGHSDHCMIHLVPAYRQRLKAIKPIIKSVKTWTEESELKLQACFDCTDWNIFKDTSADLDELTDTVTSYVSFCEDLCVPTRNLRIHSNNKPWFTPKLKQLRHSKEEAYRKGVNQGLLLLCIRKFLVGTHRSSQKLIYDVTVSVSSSRSAEVSLKIFQSVQSKHACSFNSDSSVQVFTDLIIGFMALSLCL
ncbi:uncharacterized protein LOC131197679 [Ahaetulla prasina]|uniref:uncharacterized protein LOC131197679 n=1 Tax=Ahaetulla prasina TaxID=499056 RepID=UPI002647E88D|nr:uncharacterized protein LOC131197679 [Ahaetulla prasina]